MVNSVYHFADIHIRCGDDKTCSRYNEYLSIFEELRQFFSERDTTGCIAVIAGDVFHMKGRADVFAITMLNCFIGCFPKTMCIYILRGNHDVVQQRPNDPDLLEVLLEQYENVTYIKETTVFKVGDVGFGLVDIMDVLEPGTSSGRQVDSLPKFPSAQTDVSLNVALFHGTIVKCKLQNYSQSVEGVPLRWFEGYDIAMLGDVHLRQFHGIGDQFSEGGLSWGYAGSLVQQNYGEEIIHHGFLEWDLKGRKVLKHTVKAPTGYLKLRVCDGSIQVMNNRDMSLEEILESDLCPRRLEVRVYGALNIDAMNYIRSTMEGNGIRYDITQMNHSSSDDIENRSSFVENSSIVNFNTKASWLRHIEKDECVSWYSGWRELLNDTTRFRISLPAGIFSTYVEDKLHKRDKELECIMNIDTELGSFRASTFRISFIKWAWMLCFGGENHINFGDINWYTTLISGANAVGKTSLLECILIGLYGETSPGKSTSANSGSIIHCRKPKGEKAYTTLDFTLGENDYTIHRSFRLDKDSNKIKECEVRLSSRALESDLSGARTVNDWIKCNLCSITDFLQSVMLCQTDAKDFFHMKSSEQLVKIERAQSMEAVNMFNSLLEVGKKTYISATNFLEEIVSNDLSELAPYTHIQLIEARAESDRISAEVERNDEVLSKASRELHKFEKEDLVLDVSDINERILKLRVKSSNFTTAYSKEEVLIEKGKLIGIDDKLRGIELRDIDAEYSKRYMIDHELLTVRRDELQDILTKSLCARENEQHELNKLHEDLRNIPLEGDFDIESATTKRKTLDQLIPNEGKLSRNVSKLQSYIDKYIEADEGYLESEETCKELNESIDKVISRDIPFNPLCEACNGQPWRIEQLYLETRSAAEEVKMKSFEEKLEQMRPLISEKRERLQKNMDQLSFIRNTNRQDLLVSIGNFNERRGIHSKIEERLREVSKSTDIIEETKCKKRNLEIELGRMDKIADHRLIVESASSLGSLKDLRNIEQVLQEIEERELNAVKLEYWEGILRSKDLYMNSRLYEENALRLCDSYKAISDRIEEYELLEMKYDKLRRRTDYITELKSKSVTISGISESFKSYRQDIFNTMLLPFVCNKVNALIEDVSTNDSLSLSGTLQTRNTKARLDEIEWRVCFDGSSLPIEKASGFQRAIISFAMVITLNSINTRLKNDQLFVDEGFVHFDERHLSRVFDLLNKFRGEYSQIILVSHLEQLKRNANFCIDIERDSTSGESKVVYGVAQRVDSPKKRGRPKKVY